MRNTFIADVHLGKLARLLRLLGFDCIYRNDFTKEELVRICTEEARTLLSRDPAFAKLSPIEFLKIVSEDPMIQLREVVTQLQLKEQLLPFSRCITCNGLLETATKKTVYNLLEQNTREYYTEFWQCKDCKRVYWKGSHYARMLNIVEYLRKLEACPVPGELIKTLLIIPVFNDICNNV